MNSKEELPPSNNGCSGSVIVLVIIIIIGYCARDKKGETADSSNNTEIQERENSFLAYSYAENLLNKS